MNEQNLKQKLSDAITSAVGLETGTPIQWNVPKRDDQGDLSTNIAMILAKQLHKNPREIAADIQDKVEWKNFGIDKTDIAGPGFINVWLGVSYFHSIVSEILAKQEKYGSSNTGNGKRIVVEFVSANPTGPLNIVSARAAAIGDSLVRLMRKSGYDAYAEYYINDAGRQVRRFGESILAVAQGKPVPEDGYHGDYVVSIAEQMFPSGLSGEIPDPEKTGADATKFTIVQNKKILRNYYVEFDRWFKESELHENEAPEKVLESLRANNAIEEKDGAVWFKGSEFGDEDRVLITSEGRPTYLLPDIAYHLDKKNRGFDSAIDLLGPDHLDYVGRMKAALKALGIPDQFFDALIVQQVHFISGGEKVKMSKRAGKLVTLEQLVEEVGVDVARYFFLQRKTSSPLEFDLDLAKEQSERNPVFYVQYAHTRICGILRQDGCPGYKDADLSLLVESEEIQLIKILEQFSDIVSKAAEYLEPQRLVGYLKDTATSFHKFYTAHRVIGDDLNVSAARAALIKATQIVLKEGLNLLGVSAPERM